MIAPRLLLLLAFALPGGTGCRTEEKRPAEIGSPASGVLAAEPASPPASDPPPAARIPEPAPPAEVEPGRKASGGPAAEPENRPALPAESPADSTRKDLVADSARYLVATSRLPGRTRRDSISLAAAIRRGLRHPGWPVRGPTPDPDAILPRNRIIAFYGNPLSTRMGILGEIPPERMLARLDTILAEWKAADPETPVVPALHLVAVVAQDRPGRDGKYRLRMDSTVIERVYGWARSRNAILFLDIQAGWSTLEEELPRLLPWLARPDVHLGIDPEFYMHHQSQGHKPGRKIGTLTALEVNYSVEQLSRLVAERGIPPKVLVIHRFTLDMLQGARQIRLDPRVQLVINMDGWGEPWLKFDSYARSLVSEPVQFAGFKIFFHNDTKKGDLLLTAREVLALRPRPVYIQYQ